MEGTPKATPRYAHQATVTAYFEPTQLCTNGWVNVHYCSRYLQILQSTYCSLCWTYGQEIPNNDRWTIPD